MSHFLVGLDVLKDLPHELEFQGITWTLADMTQSCKGGGFATLNLEYIAIEKSKGEENAA